MKTWTVTITATLTYNDIDHEGFVESADEARQDAIDWLYSLGASPDQFDIEVKKEECE